MKYVVLGAILFASLVAALPGGAAERKDLRIDAESLAPPALRSDEPSPGKWWLRHDARDWGSKSGILMTGKPPEGMIKTGEWVVLSAKRFVPYRVPALTVDPKAKGWYRIHVGLYHDPAYPEGGPRLLARLTGEPYSEYLQAPDRVKARTVEVYWKAADLTGKKLVLEQPPAPMNHPNQGFVGALPTFAWSR